MSFSFIDLVNTSISASWLVLAVILARLVLRKAPKSIHCILWALVAIRLLCPFSIESEFSLVPSSQTVSGYYLTQEGAMDSSPAVLDVVENPIYSEELDVTLDTQASRIGWLDVKWTAIIWPAGMAAMAIYAVISYLRVRRRVSASIKVGEKLYLCDYIDSPFILGVVKPKIYLPSRMDRQTLDHVVAHELAHLKRRDHWWKPLGFLLLTIHWFNPVMWLAYILLCRDIELACDEKVIRDMDVDSKKAYSSALLACSVRRPIIAACPLAFGEVSVKNRVKNVLHYRKPAFWIIVLAVVLCAGVAVCFLTDPLSPDRSADVAPSSQPDRIADGVYQSQEVLFWNPLSSTLAGSVSVRMLVADDTITVTPYNTAEVELGWQRKCPLSDTQLAGFYEFHSILGDDPILGAGCVYQPIDENHFLAKRDGEIYLVNWRDSEIGLEVIWYILRMVPTD